MRKIKDTLYKIQQKGLDIAVKYIIYQWINRERKISFGEKNSDKTFYLIRGVDYKSKFYTGVDLNLLANYSYVISHFMYAKKRGWIPIVDQINYPVYNQERFTVHGTNNPWEYFWEQPGGFSLETVYDSKNVVLSKRSWYRPGNPEYSIRLHSDPKSIHLYHSLMAMAPLNAETKKYCEEAERTVFGKRKRILGVSMRNAGYALNSTFQAPGHPIQPSIELLIKEVRKAIHEWNADAVFLATEENSNIKRFRKEFGDFLITYPRQRYDGWRKYSKDDPNPLYLPGKRYQTSLDYLTEMELLSRCRFFMGSITSGVRYAIFRNNNQYEHLILFDCGLFPYSNPTRI